MKNGKTLTLYMTLFTFLMELWKNLFREQKVYGDLRIVLGPRKKDGLWVWESSDGIRISKTEVFLSKVYFLSSRLGKYFRKLKSRAKGLLWLLLKVMASLCGVLVLVCVILICALLLPLYLIVSLAGTSHQG